MSSQMMEALQMMEAFAESAEQMWAQMARACAPSRVCSRPAQSVVSSRRQKNRGESYHVAMRSVFESATQEESA